jgi:hypothetical protein
MFQTPLSAATTLLSPVIRCGAGNTRPVTLHIVGSMVSSNSLTYGSSLNAASEI